MFKLKGRVKINPTEDVEKVKTAVERIFGNLDFKFRCEGKETILFFTSSTQDSLLKFKRITRQDLVRDAVRKHLKTRIKNNHVRFFLNKQVAYAGHVSLCEFEGESPLGPIEVEIEYPNVESIVDWLTEKS